MEATHLNNLVKQVKFAGFGDNFEMEIRNRIAGNEPSFEFNYKPDFKTNVRPQVISVRAIPRMTTILTPMI